MIMKKWFLPLLLLLTVMLLMAGCGKTHVEDIKSQEESSPETNVKNPATQTENQTEDKTISESGPLECNWILEVDDTIESETNGVRSTYHLVLLLNKNGGTEKSGAYTGKIYLKTEQDLASTQDEVFEDEVEMAGSSFIESQSDTVVINVIPFDGVTFAQFDFKKVTPDAPLAPLAPLGDYDGMALEKPELSHRQQYSVNMTFEDGDNENLNKDKVFNSPMTIKILVVGADVKVDIPSLKLFKYFKGTLLGIPIS